MELKRLKILSKNSKTEGRVDPVISYFKQLEWPNLKFNKKSIYINTENEKHRLLMVEKNLYRLNFFWFDRYENVFNLRNDVSSITFPKSFNIGRVLQINDREYNLPLIYLIKRIADIPHEVNKILITDGDILQINVKNKSVNLGINKFMEVYNEAGVIYKKSKSFRNSYERYLSNIAIEKFTNRKIEHKTLISKGDLNFTIQRINLNTKKSKAHFSKYLDSSDIDSAETLATSLIKNQVFSPQFLQRLSDYFIKENLQDVINLGKIILSLKSGNMNSEAASRISRKITGSKILQLETLWQKYFEKYFLYLIFSYKDVFPKIKLNDLNEGKKYPDFIGINHYNGVDIIEIKTHLKNALVYDKSHDNFAFSGELSKAIIQTMNYMDAVVHTRFKETKDKEKITNSSHEENLNRPRGIIIISSHDKLASNYRVTDREKIVRDFTKLRNSVHNIEILTFDEVLDTAEYYVQKIITNDTGQRVKNENSLPNENLL